MTDKCFNESKCKIELWITGYLKCAYNLQKYGNVKAGILMCISNQIHVG